MTYDGPAVLDAWKKVVNEDTFDRLEIRPEIAHSWVRCKNYGLDPWSLDFPKTDEKLLEIFRTKYRGVMDAASPVMQYLLTLFNCNCSLADIHGFVFDLITPLSSYPRTLGTYVSEALHGTGNLPLAICEKKPVRVDGYEHFRAVSQTYSGVSALFRPSPTEEFVLNVNEPFVPLPDNALDVCIAAGKLIEKLCVSRREMFSCLSSATFFDPLLDSDKQSVIVIDQDGMILTANKLGKEVIPGYEEFPYASRSIADYLKEKGQLETLLSDEGIGNTSAPISLKNTKKSKTINLHLLRKREVVLMNGMRHHILVFDSQMVEKKLEAQPVLLRTVEKDVEYIGQSDAWQKVDAIVRSIAGHKSSVMIMGETGTGKEVIAKAIHRLSGRKGEFVAINCGALPRDLLTSELFGYEGGAFTGARSSGAKGKFEYANGGTLFLDEIGEMPLDMQVSLLRVIQEQSVTRIGSNKPIPFDVRIIAATNRDMNQMLAKREFRSDLWYRLSVIEIHLPLLRERGGDISLLAEYFNKLLGESLQIPWHPLTQEVQALLEGYSWPGNVRELKNVMEKALLLSNGEVITADHFPDNMRASATGENAAPPPEREPEPPRSMPRYETHEKTQPAVGQTPKQRREQIEKEKIIALLEQERGNISKVAEKMNISRNTLYRRIDKLGIQIQVRAFSDRDR